MAKTCFVIMPFKSLYKGRYERIYEPAIKAAGLSPHLAGGPGVSTITKDIEDGIRNSHICFADISEDNPNVWYELGFAYACDKQVVMVCDRKKRPKKLPFDVSVKNVNFHPAVQSVANRKKFQQDITQDLTEKAAIVPMNVAATVVGGTEEQLPEDWEPMDKKVFKAIMKYFHRYSSPLKEKRYGIDQALLDVSDNPVRVMNSVDKLMQMGFITQAQVRETKDGYGGVSVHVGYAPTYAGERFARKHPYLLD